MDQPNDPMKPGYSWIEIGHRVITADSGIAALVDLRFRFIGKDGGIVNTPGIGYRLADAEALAAEIVNHAHAAFLEARAASGDEFAAGLLEQEADLWDDEHNSRN